MYVCLSALLLYTYMWMYRPTTLEDGRRRAAFKDRRQLQFQASHSILGLLGEPDSALSSRKWRTFPPDTGAPLHCM